MYNKNYGYDSLKIYPISIFADFQERISFYGLTRDPRTLKGSTHCQSLSDEYKNLNLNNINFYTKLLKINLLSKIKLFKTNQIK